MEKYFRKLHENRSPPGLERIIWRRLPAAAVGSIALPMLLSVAARLFPPQGAIDEVNKAIGLVDFFALGLGMTLLTAVLTVTIGCIVVIVMKGPAYVADGYELNAADRPAPKTKSKRATRL